MELPNELIDEILTWVPVKYVLRSRCVSKGWCSVIDSTVFVKKYLRVSIERNRGGLIIQGSALDVSGKKYLLADLESLEDGSGVVDISEQVGGILDGARVIGSVNGLVCLSMSGDGMDSIFLLNPCTRKCKKLPVAGTEFMECNKLLGYFLGGFGYDHVSDDYKVVMMARCDNMTRGIMAIVYSLKKNSWTAIPEVYNTENIGFIDTWGMFSDGVLLWKTVDMKSLNSVIVGFDLGLEQFTEAKCYNGNVQLIDISIEYSRGKEIVQNPVFGCFRSPRPVTYSKSLEKILFEMDHESFMWYDFRCKAFKDVIIPGSPDQFFVSHRYIESLFPLVEDGQPSHEGKEKKQQPKKIS